MKIYKLLISTLFGVILATLGLTAFSAYADDTTPTISTELEYVVIDDEQLVKASIYISNFEPVSCGGFHIELGDGFVFDDDEDFGGIIHYECQGTTSSLVGNVTFSANAGTHSSFVSFAQLNGYNRDINGKFLEVFLKKTQYTNIFNMTFNVLLLNNQYVHDFFADSNNIVEYNSSNTNVPHMYKSVQYVLGDVDGNGIVNSADALAIDTALSTSPYYYDISDIEDTYYIIFPNADDSWALDPNQNGILSNSDSVAISQYLYDINTYDGNIGKLLFHCYYGYYY